MLMNNQFETSDLCLAATIAIYQAIDAIDNQDNNRLVFVFNRDNEGQLDRLIESYWKGQLTVNPQHLYQQLRILKTRIRECSMK